MYKYSFIIAMLLMHSLHGAQDSSSALVPALQTDEESSEEATKELWSVLTQRISTVMYRSGVSASPDIPYVYTCIPQLIAKSDTQALRVPDAQGKTLLMHAITNKYPFQIFLPLIEKTNPMPHEQGYAELLTYAREEDEDRRNGGNFCSIAKFLLKRQGVPLHRDDEYAYDLSAYLGHKIDPNMGTVDEFLTYGHDVNFPADEYGVGIMDSFLGTQDTRGMTAPMVAIHRGFPTIFRQLIHHPAFDPAVADARGRTVRDHLTLIENESAQKYVAMAQEIQKKPYTPQTDWEYVQAMNKVRALQRCKEVVPRMRQSLEALMAQKEEAQKAECQRYLKSLSECKEGKSGQEPAQ